MAAACPLRKKRKSLGRRSAPLSGISAAPQNDRRPSVLPSHEAPGAVCEPFRPALPWEALEGALVCRRSFRTRLIRKRYNLLRQDLHRALDFPRVPFWSGLRGWRMVSAALRPMAPLFPAAARARAAVCIILAATPDLRQFLAAHK